MTTRAGMMSNLMMGFWDKPTIRKLDVDPKFPWVIWCFCGGFKPLAKAPDWRTAQDWAAKHAAAHEASRCDKCGRLP
jgi:hypothetical protein